MAAPRLVEVDPAAKRGAQPNINVTPLVDVVLVLLIIFMVVIPSMQDGKTIEMLAVKEADNATKDGSEPIKVTIDRDRGYSLGDEDLPREQVLERLRGMHAADASKQILLRGDTGVKYGEVQGFFHEVREMGWKNVSLAVAVQREWSPGGS